MTTRHCCSHSPETEVKVLKELCKSPLKHEGKAYIANLYGVFKTNTRMFVVLECCDQGDLLRFIVKRGRLPESLARTFARQLAQALSFVHQSGYVHLDVSLENTMVQRRNGQLEVRLIDFGGCRVDAPLCHDPRSCGGKTSYMCPERYEGKIFEPKLCDAWGLAICMLSMESSKMGIQPSERPTPKYEGFRLLTAGPASIAKNWQVSTKVAEILAKVFVPERTRIGVDEILKHSYFS